MVWSTLKGKNLLSEEHVFSLKSRLVWMGFIIQGRPREVKEVILALKNGRKKNMEMYPVTITYLTICILCIECSLLTQVSPNFEAVMSTKSCM